MTNSVTGRLSAQRCPECGSETQTRHGIERCTDCTWRAPQGAD
ncbi:small CPxCG-related zinc finger protein (plasmid) [Haloferax volcanii DS2]|uniref:Small CPxCG-related zinc finger protein n=1 Tax=Haloferax volcanii (strain ATCC 29605 / DSM 3757 / JCM 8879 / NBRC 14742 / NCIMB 2012 / VKM B-1768 / DS2) TaxID=309800 RepID=D4GQJ6_HALVD|nr:small CPxCG-related zinc finger protein [Haloferax volcanii DS2]